nr:kynureninase [Oceanococcus sp. HetDA_MAG_MS8]
MTAVTPPNAPLREHFVLPAGRIYLNGNSLGPLPKLARERLHRVIDAEWGQHIVSGWNQAGWVDLPQRVGNKLGALIGAARGQVVVCDSTSVNILKLLHAALSWHPQRRVLLLEEQAFPTDNYMAQGLRQLRPDLELRPLPGSQIAAALDDSVAAVLVSHINYRSGERLDLPSIQAQATNQGIPIVWDLAHSAGAVPLDLDSWGVDYAVGCGYKFLNGGPGAPAFAYVAQRHQAQLQPLLSGWFGHARPFAFEPDYQPAADINRLQVGTPPILSMSALDAALDVFASQSIHQLWQQSCALFERLLQALEADPVFDECELLTPRAPEARGSQLSLHHPEAYAICRALAADDVIADYREPGILRLGLAPAYLRADDVDQAAALLLRILREQRWRDPAFQTRLKVT